MPLELVDLKLIDGNESHLPHIMAMKYNTGKFCNSIPGTIWKAHNMYIVFDEFKKSLSNPVCVSEEQRVP